MRSEPLIETTLGAICEQQGGAIQTGPFGSQLHASDYTEAGTPVVMPADIVGGRISTASIARVGPEHVERLLHHQLQIKDIVFSRRGDVTRFARVTAREVGWLCGTGCLKVRVGNGNLALPEWISLALASPDVKEWLVRHAVGATMPNLNTSILGALPLKVPPIEQQRDAVEVCFALDDRIDLLRQTNTTLESIAQALFKSWFIDFDPVRAKQAGREPEGMDAATAALFPAGFEESALGLIPKGWHVKSIGDVATVIKGKSYKSNELLDSDTALVTLKSFERGGGFRRDGFKGYVGSYKPEQVVAPGECIVAFTDVTQNAEVIGRAALVESSKEYARLVASLDVGILRPNAAGMDASFLYFLLQDERYIAHIGGYTSGTTVLHLAKDGVPAFRFVLPPEVVLSAFADMAKFLLAKRAVNISLSEELVQLRDTLLPRLISGKLRLPEARKQLEDALA